jgi:membrane-anchored mycosin MYCP
MSRNGLAALGAVAAACGLAVVAGGAVGTVPALAATSRPARVAVRAAGAANPVPVTPASPSEQSSCQDNTPGPGMGADTGGLTSTPWAQTALNFESVWSQLGDEGQGVTVAVIDSGVDYNAQLAGRVTAIDLTNTGIQDCVLHGTGVAGIIAASNEEAAGSAFNPFVGVAPKADILSVKVINTDSTSVQGGQLTGDSATLSEGIRAAVNDGASVLSISIQTTNTTELEQAVEFAEQRNVVVVAAAGNDQPNSPIGPFYPASYPGVISVGAVDDTGTLASFADPKTQESVTAPGVNVTSIQPGGFSNQLNGTSFAAPFVSGVAALVRSYYPNMSAAEVVARIEETADGPVEPITGNGMVNPLQAVQAVLPSAANPSASSAPAGNVRPVPVARPVPPDQSMINAAMGTTAGAIAAAAVLVIGGVSISQRRRRRRGQATPHPDTKVPADAGLADSPLWD